MIHVPGTVFKPLPTNFILVNSLTTPSEVVVVIIIVISTLQM